MVHRLSRSVPGAYALLLGLVAGSLLSTPASAGVELLDTYDGLATNDLFGHAVAGGGDFDGDGVPDFIVGAPKHTDFGSGSVFIYRGPFKDPATFSHTTRIDHYGSGLPLNFGWSASFAGNFLPGDGDNIVVGEGNFGANKVWTYRMNGGALDSTALLAPTCAPDMAHFGMVVTSSGDFDGDGFTDIAVGGSVNGTFVPGLVAVYLGQASAQPTLSPKFVFVGEALGDKFGHSVAFIPDITGDSRDELVVVASGYQTASPVERVGRAYTFFGRPAPASAELLHLGSSCVTCPAQGCPSAQVVPDIEFSGTSSDVLIFAAYVGDLNGDGYSDVGSESISNLFVHWLDDQASGVQLTTDAAITVTGINVTGLAPGATPLAYGGDINGDGVDDAVIGTEFGSGGKVRVYLGCRTDAALIGSISFASLDLELTSPGNPTGDESGTSVASAGDIDGNGRTDLLVGAPSAGSTASTRPGAAFLYRNRDIFLDNESAASQLTYSGTPYSSVELSYGTNRGLFVSVQGANRAKLFKRNSLVGGVPVFSDRSTQDVSGFLEQDARGIAAADINNDGGIDFFLAHASNPQLWTWDAALGKFTDASAMLDLPGGRASLADDSWTGSWADYDRDGWVDLAIGKASGGDAPANILPESMVLARNTLGERGAGFVDVTSTAGLSGSNTAAVTVHGPTWTWTETPT